MKQSLTYASEQTRTNTVITHSKTRSIVSWSTLHPKNNNNNNNMNWLNPIAELCLPWENFNCFQICFHCSGLWKLWPVDTYFASCKSESSRICMQTSVSAASHESALPLISHCWGQGIMTNCCTQKVGGGMMKWSSEGGRRTKKNTQENDLCMKWIQRPQEIKEFCIIRGRVTGLNQKQCNHDCKCAVWT